MIKLLLTWAVAHRSCFCQLLHKPCHWLHDCILYSRQTRHRCNDLCHIYTNIAFIWVYVNGRTPPRTGEGNSLIDFSLPAFAVLYTNLYHSLRLYCVVTVRLHAPENAQVAFDCARGFYYHTYSDIANGVSTYVAWFAYEYRKKYLKSDLLVSYWTTNGGYGNKIVV